MSRIVRAAWKVIQGLITLMLALLLACNLYLIVMEHFAGAACPTIFGYSTAVIASGSMEPALSVDDLILNHAQDDYAGGDIITFRSGSSLTTHRIVEVTEDGYVTQGDANNAADLDTVPPDAVVGRVVGKIPHVGSAIAFLKTPFGMMGLVFTGILMIELPFFFQTFKDEGVRLDKEEANEK